MNKKEFDEDHPDFMKHLKKALKSNMEKLRKEHFDAGLPMVGARDGDQGYGIYEEWADGTFTFVKALKKPQQTKLIKKKYKLD